MKTKLPKVNMAGSRAITIELPDVLWRQAKAVAVLQDLTIREMVAGLLTLYVRESKQVPDEIGQL